MIEISPSNFGIQEESRIVIYNLSKKKYEPFEIIPEGKSLIISDKYFLNNLSFFKYKFQINVNGKWKDKTQYRKFYNDKLLEEILSNKKEVSYSEFQSLLETYWDNYNEVQLPEIRSAIVKGLRTLWSNPKAKQNGFSIFLNICYSTKVEIPLFWRNIMVYIEEVLTFNKKLVELSLADFSFNEINNGVTVESEEIVEFVNKRISHLESYNLEFSKLFIGFYYSFINRRDEATIAFENAHTHPEKYTELMKIDLGSYTYDNSKSDKTYTPKVSFVDSDYLKYEEDGTTILLSMDPKFLKYYATQLFYSIIALKKHHFHLHIIGNESECKDVIKSAINLFYTIKDFMEPKYKITPPTFSHEECPNFVKDKITYYACSRYIIVPLIIQKFGNDIFIMDVDLFINNELDSYFNKLSEFDVAISFQRSITAIYPWRRIMAGYVYISNNIHGESFINLTSNYIVKHLHKENSWTLDQNALSYAYEKINQKNPDIKIGNAGIYKRPMEQPRLRILIEKS